MNFFQFFFTFMKILFEKKIRQINRANLNQLPWKFLHVIWDIVTRTHPKFITLHSFFKIFQKLKKKRTKKLKQFSWILNNQWIHFNKKKGRSSDYVWDNRVFLQSVNNFSALLYKIYFLTCLICSNLKKNCLYHEILIVSNSSWKCIRKASLTPDETCHFFALCGTRGSMWPHTFLCDHPFLITSKWLKYRWIFPFCNEKENGVHEILFSKT